ncbi:hypothetical protein ACLKA7_014493 [Drosophila subpalustris]
MSNNNHPHGHLSQAAAQNPSWNPLQIPSYIPRQPQLAHMSNERPMVRSPLAWHSSAQPPPPPDAIYNFMSANHKNLDHHHQMNPLLAPPYTGTLPFDSMDLSLQSSRSAAPTLKSGQQQQQQHQQQPQQQQQQSHLQAPPNYPTIHNLTTNTPAGSQHSAQQGHLGGGLPSSLSASPASKYLNANGADCESLLPPPPSTPPNNNNNSSHNNNSSSGSGSSSSSGNNSSSNNNVPPPHYMQNRDENFKLTQLKSLQKSSELSGKDCSYVSGATGKLATHNMQQQQHAAKKPSPLRNYQQHQHPQAFNMTPPPASMKYNGPQTPPTPQSPLDYNQLHLHHQLHANVAGYAPQQQQQQHMQSEQHLHYHNQHLAPPATPIAPPPPPQFQQQSQSQQQQQQQPLQQLASPQLHSRNTQLTNLDMSKHKPTEDEAQDEAQTIITDLSTTATYRGNNADDKQQQLADAPESPYMTTSNEESLESNSNSSNSRKRRKRKSSQVMRLTPSESLSSTLKRQRTPSPHSNNNSCSPKPSPKNGVEFQPFGLKEQKPPHELPLENGRAATPPAAAATENSNSSSLYNDTDNPKTKKQRQALLQRNLTEQQQQQQQQRRQQDEEPSAETPLAVAVPTKEATVDSKVPPPSPQSNSSSSSSSSSSAGTHSSRSSQASREAPQQRREQEQDTNNKATTDTPASPALVEQGDIDARPVVSVHDDEDEVQSPAEKQSPPQAEAAVAAASTEPCHFNEVEHKLEQMFAGIEDEPQSRADDLALTKAGVEDKPVVVTPTATPTPTPELRPMATKAAMKSTLPSPIHSPAALAAEAKEIQEDNAPSSSPAKVLPRPTPTRCMPQRRLSMGMDPSLLRFTIEEQVVKPKKTAAKKKQPPPIEAEIETVQLDSDDEKPSTSAAAAAALAARKLSEAAATKTITPKANSNNNNTKKKKKTAAAKGKKATGKNATKQNGKKGATARKPFSTDEDSTPAPNGGGGSSSTAAAADLRFKSPFILIKPDGSVSIKNTHNAEDVNEKQTKKKQTKAPHERKNLRGMHSSTLSNRYDADTTDSSWICVFCKRGPHKLGLGDLFGPYLVSIDCEEYRAALQAPAAQDIDGLFVSKRKRSDMVKMQERNLPVIPATLAHIMQAPKITMHKRKRKQTHESAYSLSDDQNESQCSSQDPLDCSHEAKFIETFRGMSKTSEHGYEIWLHEDCAVWANDIQLIGAHVNGLDAAVWDSTRYQCVHCAQPGANVCCFQRACKAAAHVPCARAANWSLSEEDRLVYCEQHTPEGEATEAEAEAGAEELPALTQMEPVVAVVPPPTFNVNSLP